MNQEEFWEKRLRETKSRGKPIHEATARCGKGVWEKSQVEQQVIIRQIIQPCDSVLDAGCGVGCLVPLLPDNGCTYLGVDFARCLIEEARLQYPEKEFQVANLLDLSQFNKQQFNLTICRGIEGAICGGQGPSIWHQMKEEMERVSELILLMYQFSPTESKIIVC